MRRIGFACGLIGAVTGGIFGYVSARSTWESRANAKAFTALMKSPVISRHAQSQARGDADSFVPLSPPTNRKNEFGDTVLVNPWELDPSVEGEASVAPNSDRIRSVTFANGQVYSIRLIDGTTLIQEPGEPFYSYLVEFALPFIGFLAPWLTIKALVWIGSGFFSK
jgi:hypothetical protein